MSESESSTTTSDPRIICIGSNLESHEVLKGLIQIGANIVGLVTLPQDRASGVSDYVDMHALCALHNIATIDTRNINSQSTIDVIADLRPDYLYTLGWSQLFGSDLLSTPTHYVVGSHPSPLPAGRGRAPVPWTILQGEPRSAVSLFRMDIGVDSGPILCQKWFDVPNQAYANDVYQLVATHLREAFCELYEAQTAGTVIPELIQSQDKFSHRAKRTPSDGHIDFCRSAAAIETLVRAVSHPYPGAYSYYKGRKVTFWRASLSDIPNYVGTLGQILLHDRERLLVQTGDRPIWLFDIRIDGDPVQLSSFRVGHKFGYAIEDELHRLQNELSDLRAEWNKWKTGREAA